MYHKLVGPGGLYETEKPEDGIIIRYGPYLYRWFAQIDDFVEKYLVLDIEDRTCFEVIPPNTWQKLRFDLDGDFPDEMIDHLCQAIVAMFERVYEIILIPDEDILIFRSTGEKKSYHIIIDGYAFSDNIQCKTFAEKIITILPQYRDFIDDSVYSTNQNFRIFLSTKVGQNRYKIFVRKWYIDGRKYESYLKDDRNILLASLIVNTDNCIRLDNIDVPSLRVGEGFSVDSGDFGHLMNIYCDKNNIDRDAFVLRDVRGNMAYFNRQKPTMCPVCERVHDNENIRVYIVDSIGYVNCMRSKRSYTWIRETEEDPTPGLYFVASSLFAQILCQ
jgi:hypothetical protein